MTEKRFEFLDGYSLRYTCIIDTMKNEDKDIHKVIKQDELLELLNAQHEETKLLKKEIERLKGRYYD